MAKCNDITPPPIPTGIIDLSPGSRSNSDDHPGNYGNQKSDPKRVADEQRVKIVAIKKARCQASGLTSPSAFRLLR